MKAKAGFETAAPLLRALVVRPLLEATPGRDPAYRLAEAAGLAEALDLEVVEARLAPLRALTPATYFGSGRVEALKAEMAEMRTEIFVVDAQLSPVQQRNLEKALQVKVIDRTGLILEIFGRRAKTKEGRLQVELARLSYEKSRLVRTWTHLERQRGGLGKTGGPGETQLELDRRIIADKIERLKADLLEVRRTRGLQRAARKRAGLPTVALVGYTNAGKSSLFNRLVAANVFAKDMPFATLDPTARLIRLSAGREAILTDTVGFITDLPIELVESFRATLEEVAEADVLVHVRDIAHAETAAQCEDVDGVLAQILAGRAERPTIIEAWNKIDLLPAERREGLLARADAGVAALSAITGEGVEGLIAAIEMAAYGASQVVHVHLAPSEGRTRAWLAAHGRILSEEADEAGALDIAVELTQRGARELAAMRPGELVLAAE